MKILIANISFLEYSNLEDKSEYDYALRYGELSPKNLFDLKPLMDMSFEHVKNVQDLLTHSETGLTWIKFFEYISQETGMEVKQVANFPLLELQQARLHLKSEVEEINRLENSLGSGVTEAQEAAGIARFGKYRSFLQLDTLAAGDPTKYDLIKKLDYSVCFLKLRLDSERSEYQEDYEAEIKRRKPR